MAWCDDTTTLSITPFTISAGETIEVMAEMQSTFDDLCQAQFDIVLPEGITVPTRNGKYYVLGSPTGVLEYVEGRGYSHQIGAAQQSDGSIRVVIVSSSNQRFISNSGVLVRIRLNASEQIASGDYVLQLKNIEFTHDNATKEDVEDTSISFTVGSNDNILADGISLDQSSLTFTQANATSTLVATVTPSNVTNGSVTWTSSNTSVATVDENGVVTAIGNGNAVITATTNDGTNLSVSCNVTVITYTMGDVNGDGYINGLDIVEIVDKIMDRPSSGFIIEAADLDGNGIINGMDLVEEVSLVMSQTTN